MLLFVQPLLSPLLGTLTIKKDIKTFWDVYIWEVMGATLVWYIYGLSGITHKESRIGSHNLLLMQ
jgi:hypothetical protein